MFRILLFAFALLSNPRQVWGFRPVRQVDLLTSRCAVKKQDTAQSNPFRQVDIDLDKARDYANHFGKYPVEDVEKMRDGR
jgi:hypothetical protein